MRLGVFLNQDGAVGLARRAEELGYATALAPEGFRSDAVSVLGAVAGRTSRIGLASGVLQIAARAPVLTALTAATLDSLSGGRFRLGLGVSNPDVSLGWYGVDFDRPLRRLREYVEIVRLALRGEPVRYHGEHYRLPPPGAAETAHLRAAPVRADLPIHLAGVGPRSLELAGEVADGWIGVFSPPERISTALQYVHKGRTKAGKTLAGFEVMPSVPIAVDEDAERAARSLRGYFAHFIGLGDPARSIYYRLATELGFERAAAEIHRRRAAGDAEGAAEAVPFELIDATALLGDPGRIAARLAQYREAGVTTLGLTLLAATPHERLSVLEAAADAAERLPSTTPPAAASIG
ncbi:LLM class flavin-dependent oxidoreductase [Crossiella sp. SN42]|uniref:LLM class flavin-dependent oxidoreductase n=1 Tax=Crossiella sp. SN42 TaxID=2944808 RepID=UPI00207CF121|nr:LLM class flavin-dependent oxidoreductase [Crossiella sp. SN42]MCO1580349.1 LLM class flavin-dependent oxidoreductase [Crossiella sp. SN42]